MIGHVVETGQIYAGVECLIAILSAYKSKTKASGSIGTLPTVYCSIRQPLIAPNHKNWPGCSTPYPFELWKKKVPNQALRQDSNTPRAVIKRRFYRMGTNLYNATTVRIHAKFDYQWRICSEFKEDNTNKWQ